MKTRALSFLVIAALLFAGMPSLAKADTVPRQYKEYLDGLTYPMLQQESDLYQVYFATLVAMDAGVSSQDLWARIAGSQNAFLSIYAAQTPNQPNTCMSFLYFFDSVAYLITLDTAQDTMTLELAASQDHSFTQNEADALAKQKLNKTRIQLDAQYFCDWVMSIYIYLTGDESIFITDAHSSSGGVNAIHLREAVTTVEYIGGPVTVDLSADIDMVDGMTDFSFLLDGVTAIPTTIDSNGHAAANFTVKKNGVYVIRFRYTLNGVEYQSEMNVDIDQIDEKLIAQKAADEAHAAGTHDYQFVLLPAHPHAEIRCLCGATLTPSTGPGIQPLLEKTDCCLCGYHDYADIVRLPGGSYRQLCSRDGCNAYRTITPSEERYFSDAIMDLSASMRKDYAYERADGAQTTNCRWQGIASQSTNLLSGWGFVLTTELLNTYSDMTGSIAGAVKEMGKDTWNDQQVAQWEVLITRMLTEDIASSDTQSAIDILTGTVDFADAAWKGFDDSKEAFENVERLLLEINVDKALTEQLSHSEFLDTLKESSQQRGMLEKLGELGEKTQNVGYLMNGLSAISDGLGAADETKDRLNELAAMLVDSAGSVKILDDLIKNAEADGNLNLAQAAKNVKAEMLSYVDSELGRFLEISNSMFKEIAGNMAMDAVKEGAKGLLKEYAGKYVGNSLAILQGIQTAAKGIKFVVNWDEAYQSGQELMMLQQMNMDIRCDSSYYMAELWAFTQIEGAEKSKEFLEQYEKGLGLSTKDFGIDDRKAMNTAIDQDIVKYQQFIQSMREEHAQHSN